MANKLKLLQEKVDQLYLELANYESEKANLKVVKQAGIARRGASVKLAKLQGSVRGAKLLLSNAEKKLNEALALILESSPQQPSLAPSGSHVPNQMVDNGLNQSQDTLASEPGPMHVDNASINQPITHPEGTSLPTNSSSMIADSAEPFRLGVDALNSGPMPSLSPKALNAWPRNAIPSDDAVGALDVNMNPPDSVQVDHLAPSQSITVSPSALLPPGFTMPLDPKTVQALKAPPSQPMEVSEQHTISFKHMNGSESENEEDSLHDEMDMSLITVDDKAQLQQRLFQRRFTRPPASSRKRVKYVQVSSGSASEGDPNIFDDDDKVTERTDKTGLTKLSNTNATVAAKPEPVPPANNSQQSKEGIKAAPSKGKDREKNTQGGGREGAAGLKGKGLEKDLKVGEGIGVTKGGNTDTNANGKDKSDKEEYWASEHSITKAARLTSALIKQCSRLADEATHRQFAENWLNARSAAERLELPDGIELIRFDPEYLPDVATANYRLAIQLLLNQSNNYLCIPHIKLNRKLVSHVDNLEGPVQIRGTPLPHNQNANSKSSIARTPNHFHCGCHKKVALAGFVMWKTWKARTWIDGQLVVEGLHKYKVFHPCDVSFILQFLKSKFGYTVEDMFTGSFDEEEELRKEAQVMKKVANFCARCHYELIGQKMMLDDNFPVQEEELKMEWI